MNQSRKMSRTKTGDNAERHAHKLLRLQRPFDGEQLGKVGAIDELHTHNHLAFDGIDAIHANDVLVLDRSEGFRLTREANRRLHIAAMRSVQNLACKDRGRAAVDAHNSAERTATDFITESVGAIAHRLGV